MSEEVIKVKKKYEDYLMNLRGVVGVGVNGSIIVYVKELTPQLKAMLPRTLDGIPVRIVVTGTIVPLIEAIPVAHAVYAARTDRWRPVPGGVSCGHPKITAGTFACRAIDRKTGEVFGLSNNHVIALRWGKLMIGKKGDATLQPGPYDGGMDPVDKIGELERWVDVELNKDNLIDAAIFKEVPKGVLKEEVLDVGKPDYSVEPSVGDAIVKSGRSSGVTYSKVFDTNATVLVEGWGTCKFTDVIIAKPAFSIPGDSGSWVGRVDDCKTVGLVFAGSTEVTVICKGTNIENLLGVNIIPPSPPIPPELLLSMIGITLGSVSIMTGSSRKREGVAL